MAWAVDAEAVQLRKAALNTDDIPVTVELPLTGERTLPGTAEEPRLLDLDAAHGGSLIEAQLAAALGGGGWPSRLLADVSSVSAADFALHGFSLRDPDLQASLDLVAVTTAP